jgi:methylamine utilization protein MauE
VIEIGSGPAAFVAGFTASCGVLVVLAGASKIYRAARGSGGGSAIRRALRMTRRRWRRLELVAGGLECAVGALVCAGRYPVAGGAAMAGLGAVFCVLTGYARIRRLPGGCGCIEWRSPARRAAQPVSRRDVARAAIVLGGGVLGAAVARGMAPGPGDPRSVAGALAGGAILLLVSVHTAPRTPVCHRGLWFPARAALRALTRHGVFAAMAESAGPFGPVVRHRRAGCADEFWFTPAARPGQVGGAGQVGAVVFLASYPGPGGALAVQASLRGGPAAIEAPPRAIGLPPAFSARR